jgi:hypothetical protein
MTTPYEIIDEIITEMFGEPDPALGGYVLDRGNLVHLCYAALEEFKKEYEDLEDSIIFTRNPITPIRNLGSFGTVRPIVFDPDSF